jgi:23S rRNA (guanosine2251-2'-O)-methyltransferase
VVNRKRRVVLVVHNVRSALNVGSLLRTAEGLGVEKIFLSGYTPYPEAKADSRLPHIRQRIALQIHKTALGAEYFISWQHEASINSCLDKLVADGFLTIALEQTPQSQKLDDFNDDRPVALIVGNEVTGLEKSVLKKVQGHIQIPMNGRKESFNVAIAAAIAIYHLRYLS